jgi:hypothetical protein
MNLVFANQEDEYAIYPLTTREIAEAQKHDIALNTTTDKYGYTTQLGENTKVLCKDGKMVIPVSQLPSTPREHVSRGNSLSLDVLKRCKKDSPITCQKMS